METTEIEFVQGSVKKATVGMSSADLWKVPRDRIVVKAGFNVRDHDDEHAAHIRQIADSMKANGYMQDKPLAGYVGEDDDRNNVLILTDGHCRLEAYDLAVSEGMEPFDLPMVTKPRGTSEEDLVVALATSNTGRRLKPNELAIVCKRLVDFGWDTATIAKRLCLTKPYVESLLDFLAAPKPVRYLVSSGKISATLAVETIKKHGAKNASKMLKDGVKEAEAKGKTRATAKHVKAAVKKAEPAPDTAAAAPDTQPATTEKPQQDLDTIRLDDVINKGFEFIMREPNESNDSLLVGLLAHIVGADKSELEAKLKRLMSSLDL